MAVWRAANVRACRVLLKITHSVVKKGQLARKRPRWYSYWLLLCIHHLCTQASMLSGSEVRSGTYRCAEEMS